jgi:hypothetical protein
MFIEANHVLTARKGMKTEWTKPQRSQFIGGSDARIIVGTMRPPCGGCGVRNGAKRILRTSPATSLSNSASPLSVRLQKRQLYLVSHGSVNNL